MCFPWALARLLPSAVRVRIRSRSTSAKPPSTASIKRPVLVVLSAHGSAKDRNCALASTMRLTMPNRCYRRGGQSASPHHVAGGKLAGIRLSSRRSARAPVTLLAADVPARASGLAKLLKLAVEGLPVGGDAGIADKAFFEGEFRSYTLCKA